MSCRKLFLVNTMQSVILFLSEFSAEIEFREPPIQLLW